ncbi:facilitated trehalose transporter Tret1-like [Cydia fagiglandana]|uniref:facilitated trehalose transporter Tret1-like n=1 Tax=Cydia fagiglandana TaxID=1458189 RepID=UPI002FEDE9E9
MINMTANDQNTKNGSVHKQWIIGFISTTMILTYGLQSGWMSPTISTLQSERSPCGRPLTTNEISLVAGLISMTAITTAVIFGYIADYIGRRKTLILIVIPQILGFALKIVSAHPICLMVAQACCGIAGGGVYCVSPTYVKEIAQDSIRGVLGCSGILLQSLGLVIMYAMGAYMEYYTVLWIVVWLPILNLIALFQIPESPAFLVKTGKVEEATKVMAWLRGVEEDHKEVERDITILQNEMMASENLPAVTWKSILSDKVSRRALGLSFLCMTMLDLGGNYGIVAYASVILKQSGVTFSPELQALSFPILMTLGSLISAVTIEKFGRKPLIMVSAIFTGTPLAVLGAMLLVVKNGGSMPPWIPVACIGVCLYASGQMMSLPFIVMSEMFNVQMRTKVLGLLSTYGWSLAGLQTLLFAPITERFGMYTIFFTFALVNAIGTLICAITMPETKGKTLAEINKELLGR